MTIPREGMMATVRNRRAVVTRVKLCDGHTGRLHLVDLEYTDVDGGKAEDSVIWEREVGATLVEPGALPDVHGTSPMTPRDFDALVRASRWSALTPFLATDGSDRAAELPLASPFHGAVQVEDFQLVPLLKALQMPRISLLLADDVGLGKTVEAGLVLTELLLRRRIRRVLILTPAALRDQWQQEMHEKFSLGFDLVDRQETHVLRRRLGLDANPWRTFSRIVTSYHYLRQEDVLQDFLAASRQRPDLAQLPWDLLIVDEAHNLMPSSFGEDSQLAKMLRTLSPLFEHKLFLTATPHNGHTRCFSGLLELLDPVRFNRTHEFTAAERARVRQVVVRRLKREINELDAARGTPPRFPFRHLRKIHLDFAAKERRLAGAFAQFRATVKRLSSKGDRGNQTAGAFAVEILNKRLLSSPTTFADSWYRFLEGTRDPHDANQAELFAARRSTEEDLPDDREKQDRGRHAAHIVGAWLKPLVSDTRDELVAVTEALDALGLRPAAEGAVAPTDDARFNALLDLIEERLREGTAWSEHERLIVFTEYKTTLDDLERRLVARYEPTGRKSERVRVLYGGMELDLRRAIKDAFNDPADPVRVLIATDAASEGLNLQETARLLLHYDVPWNPSRLEQRNGRLDRHGQARDVTIFHFSSEDDADLKFLAHVVEKVEQIREDLGTLGELFDRAFERRFIDLADADELSNALDGAIGADRDATAVPTEPADVSLTSADQERIDRLCRDLDLSPQNLRDTLDVALGLENRQPHLDGPDVRGRYRLNQVPARWRDVIDDGLRLPMDGSSLAGAVPYLVFDPQKLVEERLGRPVFRPMKDTVLLHLGHPMFRQALSTFARLRFPGAEHRVPATRWLVRRGPVPQGAAAVVSIAIEELAVNALREPFHHWVRTLAWPVHGDSLGEQLPYAPPSDDPPCLRESGAQDVVVARGIWEAIGYDVRDALRARSDEIESKIGHALEASRDRAVSDAAASFDNRVAEVTEAMKKTTLKAIEKEIDAERKQLEGPQQVLFEQDRRDRLRKIAELEEELERRRAHSAELIQHLQREKERVVERLLPQRFSLRGGVVQVFPLTVEIRLPEVSR